MMKALPNLTGSLLVVVCAGVHCDQKDACDSFSSFHQTLTNYGTFNITNQVITISVIIHCMLKGLEGITHKKKIIS